MTEQPRDKANNPLQIGDFIVYAHLLGRSAALKYGRIIGVKKKEGKLGPYDSDWSIRVVGVDDSYAIPKLSGPGTLLFPDRCLRVIDEGMPHSVWNLLRRAEVLNG